jgi:hypothetical protein
MEQEKNRQQQKSSTKKSKLRTKKYETSFIIDTEMGERFE